MKTFYLSENLRQGLKNVWGIPIFGKAEEIEKEYNQIIKKKRFKKIVSVGDRCSLSLFSDIKIFDKKINRKAVKHSLKHSLKINNPAGTIQAKAWSVVKKALKENKNVFVKGEEDLLVIPVVLLAEPKTAVLYGFFNKGICLIEVSKKTKQEFKELLNIKKIS